jgi:hypothetical protein
VVCGCLSVPCSRNTQGTSKIPRRPGNEASNAATFPHDHSTIIPRLTFEQRNTIALEY